MMWPHPLRRHVALHDHGSVLSAASWQTSCMISLRVLVYRLGLLFEFVGALATTAPVFGICIVPLIFGNSHIVVQIVMQVPWQICPWEPHEANYRGWGFMASRSPGTRIYPEGALVSIEVPTSVDVVSSLIAAVLVFYAAPPPSRPWTSKIFQACFVKEDVQNKRSQPCSKAPKHPELLGPFICGIETIYFGTNQRPSSPRPFFFRKAMTLGTSEVGGPGPGLQKSLSNFQVGTRSVVCCSWEACGLTTEIWWRGQVEAQKNGIFINSKSKGCHKTPLYSCGVLSESRGRTGRQHRAGPPALQGHEARQGLGGVLRLGVYAASTWLFP